MTAHHVNAVLDAIRATSGDGIVDSNRVRPRIPDWVPPQTVGRVYSQLRRAGVIERFDWTVSTDERGGNAGKPVPLYRLIGDLAATMPVGAAQRPVAGPERRGPVMGPCARCGALHERYGAAGRPLCGGCAS